MQLRTQLAALAAASLLATGAFANDMSDAEIQQKRLELTTKQAALLSDLDRVNDIGRADAAYSALRAKGFDSQAGLPALASSWDQATSQWLAKFDDILVLCDQASAGNADDFDTKVRLLLASQAQTYAQLQTKAEAIAALAHGLTLQLNGIAIYPDSYIKGYEDHTRSFNRRVDELKTAVAQYESLYGANYMDRWHTATDKTRQAVLARIKVVMLRYPDLEATLSLANQAFLFEEKLNPAVLRVSLADNEFKSHLLANRVYHAADALVKLRQVAASAIAAINASDIDPSYTTPEVKKIKARVSAAEALAKPGLFSAAVKVATYIAGQQKIQTLKCRDDHRKLLVNCELLRSLNHFDLQTIKQMNEGDLRQLEFAFDQVAAGPAPIH